MEYSATSSLSSSLEFLLAGCPWPNSIPYVSTETSLSDNDVENLLYRSSYLCSAHSEFLQCLCSWVQHPIQRVSIFIILCYMKDFSREDVTHSFWSSLLLIPYREASTFQCTCTIKIQFCDPMSFIGVTNRIMDEGLLTRAETAERQVHHQSTSQLGDSSQKLEVWSTLQNLNRFGVLYPVGSIGWYF